MSNAKWTAEQIPDLSGKVVIVTGANSGLGFESAKAMAAKGATVILGCRNEAKAATTQQAILAEIPHAKLENGIMDLSSLASIQAFAEEFKPKHDRLDILMNNAGIMAVPQGTTVDGFERQIGVNHLGHFALTGHLLELLDKTPNSRVVNVSSLAANDGKMDFDDLMKEHSYDPLSAYQQSKLANQLFTLELQRRFAQKGTDTIAVHAHPGGSITNLANKSKVNFFFSFMIKAIFPLFASQPWQGALPQLYAGTAEGVKGGEYFGPDGFREIKGYPKRSAIAPQAKSQADQQKLWEVSEKLTGVTFGVV